MTKDKVKPRRGEQGAAMILALMFMFFGSLAAAGIILYVQVNIADQANVVDRAEAYYAAESGICAVINDLVDEDPSNDPPDGSSSYAWTEDAVNSHTPVINITFDGATQYTITSCAGRETMTVVLNRNTLWMGQPTLDIISWEK